MSGDRAATGYPECQYGVATSCGTVTRVNFAGMNPPTGCTMTSYDAWAQLIKGNYLNTIERIRVAVLIDSFYASCPATRDAVLNVNVWASDNGTPGQLIASYPVSPISSYPDWNEVVISGGIRVPGDFFIGYDVLSFVGTQLVYAVYQRDGDTGPCPLVNGGAWVHWKPNADPADVWWNRSRDMGRPDNLVAEVDFCYIPDTSAGCCFTMNVDGHAGNVDGDPWRAINISDLTALIDYLFINFTPLWCRPAANIDGSPDGSVDISDLSALIDFLFINFTSPAVCR
ncbi:MAG: hypothetical protein HY851_04470 [candidate division Zixibacteria bacterium]|nr:hypothetical protein [candidate division Zixibacteria bacterium]